jgi:DNA (cytosine-5)-methyltransferase 1
MEKTMSNKNKIDILSSNSPSEHKAGYTHYLNNSKNGISAKYKSNAEQFVRKNFNLTDLSLESVLKAQVQINLKSNRFPFLHPKQPSFKFIDLFAGVGGFRLALQSLNGKSIFSSEWDVNSQKTYYTNYGEFPFGDITSDAVKSSIPDSFDILCAGFPCQAFSIAGERKGFQDTRGTLFFDLEEIIAEKRPKVIFLENVKNLQSHDKGITFKTMMDTLENKLGYKVFYQVLNSSKHANIPQNRERVFIVGFDPKQIENYNNFEFPEEIKLTKTIHDILDSSKQDDYFYYNENQKYYPILKESMTSRDTVYQWRRVYVRENKSNVCPTLTANMGTGGHNVPLIKDNFGIRKLTPKECFLFQGYPDDFTLPDIARSKLYMQAGNSVTVPLIKRIAERILDVL